MEARPHIFLISVLPRRGWSRPQTGSFMSTEGPSIPVGWASGPVETCCRNENRSPNSRTQARVSAALPTELYQLLCGYTTQLQVSCSRNAYCHGSFCARAERHLRVLQWTPSCHQLPGRASTLHNLNNSRTPIIKII